MTSSSSSSTKSSPPMIRRCRAAARPIVIPTLRDEDIKLPESPRAGSPNFDDDEASSMIRGVLEETAEGLDRDDEIASKEDLNRAMVVRDRDNVEMVAIGGPSSSRRQRGQRRRGPRRKGETRGPEYF